MTTKKTTKKTAKKTQYPDAQVFFSECTFKTQGPTPETLDAISAIARGLEANAQGLGCLADVLKQAPGVVIKTRE